MSHIFVSHVEEDTALARELSNGLEAAGYSTWHYQRDTVPGAPYLIQVGKAIEDCRAFVVIVSPISLGSNQVTTEVVRAFESGKHFIPVLSGITDAEFKERQPLWRQALGASTSILIPPQGIADILPRIIDGLKALGLQPEGAVSTPTTHTPKHLAEKILAARKGMEGERKQVTVLFADVTGFTSISEQMDPEEVHGLMSECLAFLTEEVHRYEGTIAQFLGDGILALFGAPIAHEDAPQRALHAALGIRERLREYALKLQPKGIEFNMRLGLNTGLVIVGKIGDDLTMEYTAMGDTVNLASRMQGLAQPRTILVSESTHRLTEGYFDFRPLGEVEVKGKKKPVKAYELLGLGQARTRLGVSVTRGLTPFVGRKKELGHLMDCYQQAKSGSGQVVGVVGEAGVGKSRLLFELRRTLPEGERTFLEGRCLHYGGSMPYLPFLDILRAYFGIEEGDREYVIKKKMNEQVSQLDEKLKDALPPLQDILSLKVEDGAYLKLDPSSRRMRIFEAIRDILVGEGRRKPLVLAIEDLHWIDKTSEEFLGYLIGFLANTPILLLLLYRPEYTHQWTSKSYYRQIGVDQLSLPSSAELVQSILERGEVAPELRELILNRAAGNPLFMEEFTHTLLENGAIGKKDHQYVLTRKPSEIQIPDTIQGIIAARMDRLEENMKRTMQVASVIGRDFAYRILQTITGMREELKSYLINLQGLEFIYEKSLFPELEYIFKHALTQEVAYNSLLLRRRKEIHERIGKAIEELYPNRLEEFYEMLAYHYSRSENLEKAFQYLRLSSIKTGARHSIIESVRLGKEAVDVLNRMPQTDDNKRRGIEMRLLLSGPLAGTGQSGEALQMMEEGAGLAEELGDNKGLADLCGTISVAYSYGGDTTRGVLYAERAFQAAGSTGDVVLMANTGLDLCMSCTYKGDSARVVEVAPAIMDLLEKEELHRRSDLGKYYNLNLYSSIQAFLGQSLGGLGDFEAGQALCEKACRFAEETGNLYAMALTQYFYSLLLLQKGDGRRAIEHMEKAISHADKGQLAVVVWWGAAVLGYGYYLLGDLKAARQQLERRLEISKSVPVTLLLSMTYYVLGMVDLDSGDPETARGHFEDSLRLAKEHGDRIWEGISTVLLGRVMGKVEPSQSGDGEEIILDGIRILEELRAKPWQAQGHLFLGELYADTGQNEKALVSVNKAHEMCQEMGMDYWLARTEKALEKLKAVD